MTGSSRMGLSEEQRGWLVERARRRSFRKGEVVFHEGDPGETLHAIEKGHFMIEVTSPTGEKVALAVFGPGDLFGELALVLDHAHRTASVVSLEAGETLSLHRDDFDAIRRDHPDLTETLLKMVAEKVGRYTQHLLEALHVPADKRVLRRLLELHGMYGDDLPLRQEDLAALAGTSRASANQLLRREESRGTVRLARSRIEILNLDAITERSE